ncbi:formyltetrahydrofolate-dependent phosphoribosylglycinamide formyltransferase [Nocardia tenerifensis]|uniref:Phosphoribosylglycinamide formyltransferase n=1 Tax=Nocardia tenerifensis TaxID=228006 RepID=A0A318KAW8_9NOCA|nr:phosphoribosylglycinamide formyltransferase [Nocardia tenerifensis]PXX71691.1 formyltetrahydrofolate-dependent phosphoribosylglycinamide formyltransferase [Nocardia tenerifensis]
MSELRVAVLASHNGSNMRALHEASLMPTANFKIVLVVSNNSASGALAYASRSRIPTVHLSGRTHSDPDELDEAMRAALVDRSTDLVVLAGYMKHVGPRTRRQYESRMINIHPALLPRHGGPGMYGHAVHKAVLDSGDEISGPSVHYVTEEYDAGEIIAQRRVPVLATDTVESLAARVLAAEHVLLPEVVRELAGSWRSGALDACFRSNGRSTSAAPRSGSGDIPNTVAQERNSILLPDRAPNP